MKIKRVMIMQFDWSNVIVAIIALFGTFIGSYSGIRLMSYRIEQLEKKVEKHNQVVDRVYRLEEQTSLQEEKIKVANHRIDDLEKLKKEC